MAGWGIIGMKTVADPCRKYWVAIDVEIVPPIDDMTVRAPILTSML